MSGSYSVIVGGSKGIGLETARLFQSRGLPVAVVSRKPPAAERTIAGVDYFSADVSDAPAFSAALAPLFAKGPIQNVILFQRFRGTTDSWDGEIQTTLTGLKNAVAVFGEKIASGGSVVVVGSVNGLFIDKDVSAEYHLAKAGLDALVRYYAVQLGRRGVRVNLLSPGTVLKEESKQHILKDEALVDAYNSVTPLGRMGTALDVARAAALLCRDDASFITGQNIIVDGGLSLLLQDKLLRDFAKSPQDV